MGGLNAMQQGKYESGIGKINARMAEDQARDSISLGREEAGQFYQQAGQVKGDQIAAMAANGIDIGSGTALTIQQDTEQGVQDDAHRLYRNIHERTKGHLVEAWNYREAAKAAKVAGKQAFIGSLFEAGSTLMGGASKSMKMSSGTAGTPGLLTDVRSMMRANPSAF